nr:UDP-N-acetylglucosamine 2-epimerase (non-hydrolyzing) [Dermacoccus sp. Tok2021]
MSVVGARPQFVKLAPIARAMAEREVEHIIVHTGQHYDVNMSDVFFEDLGIPAPDEHLAIGSASHGRQTGQMLAAMDGVLEKYQPDWVLVYGDTNSTTAGALSAAKMHIRVAHLEAGLRSFNREMPEELNRIVTDHLAELCLAPTQVAMDHLASEGLADKSVLVGDVMTDVLMRVRDQVISKPLPAGIDFEDGQYRVATLHRPSNTDDPERLREIIEAIGALDVPTVLLAHPRLRSKADDAGVDLEAGNITLAEPFAYPDLVRAVMGSAGVITDSGGLQKEAFLLRARTATVRTETEWIETVNLGWNTLCPQPQDIAAAFSETAETDTYAKPYGDGNAASRVVEKLVHFPPA